MTTTLILGGTRSGKSTHAEQLAATTGKEVVYIATAEASDTEMEQRIRQHRHQRAQYQEERSWITVEEPLQLGAAITRHSTPQRVVLVDCLTVWLSNLLFSEEHAYPEIGQVTPPPAFHTERGAFLEALTASQGDVILVSNEVGMGIVPMGAISRWYADEAGRLNQSVAKQCDRVILVTAGLPLTLKG